MKIETTGLILYTRNYEETVKFYRIIFGLETLYTKENLTCLKLGSGYLMIELDDEDQLNNPNKGCREKFCIRFNVKDVKQAIINLKKNNIPFEYYEYDWGQLAKFKDPDGNLVGLRSSKDHLEDISKFNS